MRQLTHPALLLRDRSGWRALPLQQRCSIGADAAADLRLADCPDGAWLRLRREGDAVVAVGEGVSRAVGAAVAGRPTRLQPGDVLRMGAVALVLLEEVACGPAALGSPPLLQAGAAVSGCPAVHAAWGELLLAAATDWPLLLLGPSGTGKELAAQLAHAASPRRDRPMVSISAAALPPGTLHAELFGAKRGAYTGSVADREGAFGRADGGTLLIDEIGELDAAAQATLLRVLESGEITPLGGATRQVDVRVLAATHRDLAELVEQGRFRLDLFHRLMVGSVTLPALRDRGDDAAAVLTLQLGRPLDAACRATLAAYDWPGNLRELRNVGRRVQLSIADGRPTAADLQAAIDAGAPRQRALARPAPLPAAERRALRRERVAAAVASHASTAAACRASGLPRASFYRALRELRQGGGVRQAGAGREFLTLPGAARA